MNGLLFVRLAEVWHRASGYLRDRGQAWRATREIEALDPHEAVRVLAEAGLAPAQFKGMASQPFAFEDLMSKGMRSIGIDRREFAVRHGAWFRSLEHNCASCQSRGRCRQINDRSQFAERFREFCPNRDEFDEILQSGTGGA